MANIVNGTSTGSGGLITTGDSSDELQLQTAETTAVTITSGQQSAFIAGTASAPAVTTTGDLNTGIYFPAADNIGFATGGTIRGRWTTDGLCFGTDTAAANALDDYEEGTWTPTVNGTSSAGTGTYSDQVGSYTKIGRCVYVQGFVVWSAHTGTGNLRIGSLPFTSGSYLTLGNGRLTVLFSTLATSANNVVSSATVSGSSTNADIEQNPVGGGSTSSVAMDTAAGLYFAGSYFV